MRLEYQVKHNLTQIHQELMSLPYFQPKIGDNGDMYYDHTVEGDGDTLIITVPDGTPVDEIEQIVYFHQPSEPSPTEKWNNKDKLEFLVSWAKSMGFVPPWE